MKLMQHLLHIMKDLIETFVTLHQEILYTHKTNISTAIKGRREFLHIFCPPPSFQITTLAGIGLGRFHLRITISQKRSLIHRTQWFVLSERNIKSTPEHNSAYLVYQYQRMVS